MRHALECVSIREIRKFEQILRQFKEETRRLSSAKSRVDDAEMAQKTPKLRIREFLRHTLVLTEAYALSTACDSIYAHVIKIFQEQENANCHS